MLELDKCCVKDSELYLWNFMLTNRFLPFGEFEPGTFGSALSNQNIIVGSDMYLCDKLQNVCFLKFGNINFHDIASFVLSKCNFTQSAKIVLD